MELGAKLGLLLGWLDGAPEMEGLSEGIDVGQPVLDGDSLGRLLG